MDLCDSDTYTIELLFSLVPIIALTLSELLPFLTTDANGLLEGLTNIVRRIDKQKMK